MAVSLSRQKVVNQWGRIVPNGAGKEKWILDRVEQLLKEANMPNVTVERVQVIPGALEGLFGTTREFLLVKHKGLKNYSLYISARSFGQHLEVSRFLTIMPGLFKGALSKHMTGNPFAMSMNVNLFDQQDLNSFTSIAGECLEAVTKQVAQELGQNVSFDTKSKGILGDW